MNKIDEIVIDIEKQQKKNQRESNQLKIKKY